MIANLHGRKFGNCFTLANRTSYVNKRIRNGKRAGWLSVCLFVLAVGGGCSEHRIDYDQFLLEEEERIMNAALAASEEPQTAITADYKAVVDKALAPFTIGPTDVLNVTLTGIADVGLFPLVQVRVKDDGNIQLPLAGALQTQGLTVSELEDRIRAAYVPDVVKDLAVHVEVVSSELVDVMVYGAVSLPGLVTLQRNQRNMLYAILAAGGASDLASGVATLRRIRDPHSEETYNLRDITQVKEALELDPLQNGDVLFVEAAPMNTIYVGGLVNRPGPQPYAPGTQVSILQALASAQGLRTDIFPHDATLTRRMPDGTNVHVRLDLDRLTTGKDPDILLAAGDILWVPPTWDTRLNDWANQNLYLRAGATANISYNINGIEYMNRQTQQSTGLSNQRSLQDQFDPFGFIVRNQGQQAIQQSISNLPTQ